MRRLAAYEDFSQETGGAGFVLVRVVEAKGSTPRDTDAWMLVSTSATFGTIGGGRLELEAIDQARAVFAGTGAASLALPLGPAIGQCCGGHVTLSFEIMPPARFNETRAMVEAEDASDPEVWLFGGGHVGRALAAALLLLPVKVHVAETREDELALTPAGADRHLTALPESLVESIAPGSAVIVLTHDHALDFLIVSAALARDDLAQVGMIGSDTKRMTFEHQYVREGGDRTRLSKLTCPIGRKVADKRPEVIAATVAADIIAALADWREARRQDAS
ncbi:MAG: xanthine dehydrogenase accessory protein XdhC [Hoeflea sp.]|uniref:xanthine dehydrogenase accessory protein XdhC n=1 Tax=Hoeflea sp. TaxID=1940281 RepID=UPI001DCCF52D|nr:xanthine dehydrogenase accessory protein XdhC [Hoeflea sp.]MBU4527665.1 xanthine dehydrogenase accessory protein XdhC [Alphaproteobacteria bacterium]MBU4546467.1 xanthine dehydrogenase accessory protein XdhC [Alphaproteobacteria bacterium]MBU4553015.1 xanthine dehydrogenase accessory protein XdhC [Alphaproteobacteria bacterium]MBV1724087.1 xanthine dehydrogenase accessory protein XdhC [Hoeflea sp.]MBV1759772.1 xanthine dehydrogenase accessory protein XdhC [Hoeflea sp.]